MHASECVNCVCEGDERARAQKRSKIVDLTCLQIGARRHCMHRGEEGGWRGEEGHSECQTSLAQSLVDQTEQDL